MNIFINENKNKPCPVCKDIMTDKHDNYLPMWSDQHDDVVCASCYYDSLDEKQYLVWKHENDYRIYEGWLPNGMKLTTQGDDSEGFVVDVSHWDSADLYEFEQAENGDKIAQLEGLVEHQTTPTECSHPIETWKHHFDPTTTLGDYYTCGVCGYLTQVG